MRIELGISQRLTLWWIALFAAGLVLFAVLAAAAVESAQRKSFDDELAAQAQFALAVRDPVSGQFRGRAIGAALPSLTVLSLEGGRLVALQGATASSDVVQRAESLPVGKATITSPGGSFRAVVAPASQDPSNRVVAVAGEYAFEEEEERVRNGFLIAALPILAFAGFTGWFLARRSLAPIERIRAAAAEIAQSGRPSARLTIAAGDELGRLARTLDDMLAQLEASFERERSSLERERSFIGDVSHELRNPITAINTAANLALQRDRLPEEYQRSLAAIAQRSKRLGQTIDDLLLLARADAGILKTQETTELNELVSQVCGDLVRKEPGTRVEVQVTDVALNVLGSPSLLLRLFQNLITNARRLAKTAVRVSVTHEGVAVVAVEDDGPGVPEERQLIFRRFFRGAAPYEGTGLGLPIAAAIAHAYGGTIDVEDRLGGGARFVVRLPIVA